jgi:hypothetical protein
MAICYLCQSETQLYDNGTPICLTCSDASYPKAGSRINPKQRVDDLKMGKLYHTTSNE